MDRRAFLRRSVGAGAAAAAGAAGVKAAGAAPPAETPPPFYGYSQTVRTDGSTLSVGPVVGGTLYRVDGSATPATLTVSVVPVRSR